jgi:hypothetical protein
MSTYLVPLFLMLEVPVYLISIQLYKPNSQTTCYSQNVPLPKYHVEPLTPNATSSGDVGL